MNGLFVHLCGPAYIDGGSGSMLLQMALAGVFASLYAMKGFWYKLRGKTLAPRKPKDTNIGG